MRVFIPGAGSRVDQSQGRSPADWSILSQADTSMSDEEIRSGARWSDAAAV
jgi:hypothetical protein